MKKKLLLIVALTLITCILVACNKNDEVNLNSGELTGDSVLVSEISPILVNSIREVKSDSKPVLKDSYKDSNYYYYFFSLGKLNNVPLENFSNLFQYEYHGQEVVHKIETTTVETESVTATVNNTTADTIHSSSSKSLTIGASGSLKQILNLSAQASYQRTSGNSSTTSFSETHSQVSEFSKQNKKSIDLHFNADAQDGYYGYVMTGALDMYAMVAWDLDLQKYTVEYYSTVTNYWYGFYFFEDSYSFVDYEYDTINFEIPSDLPVPERTEDLANNDPIKVTMERFNCNDGNEYNKYEQEESADWRSRHNGYELGELMLYGCSESKNSFSVKDKNAFSLKYHVLQNTENLPRVGTALTHVEDDTAKGVVGTNINSKIGYGAYWVRITYSDQTQTQYNATNQFYRANANTYIELLDDSKLNKNKNLSKIEVVVVYELYSGGPGVFGIWWHEYSNWRCEYTFNFA